MVVVAAVVVVVVGAVVAVVVVVVAGVSFIVVGLDACDLCFLFDIHVRGHSGLRSVGFDACDVCFLLEIPPRGFADACNCDCHCCIGRMTGIIIGHVYSFKQSMVSLHIDQYLNVYIHNIHMCICVCI